MDWIPWHSSRYDSVRIIADGTRPVPYRSVLLAPVRCGHARCDQNYFDQCFFVEGQRVLGFHAGLN